MTTPPFAVVRAPDFPPDLDWLFTDGDARTATVASAARALTLADLRGKIVVVDLWTYGCINCQHVLATLAALEQRFARELVVVGVHSGKFIAERETARIAHAARRLGASGHAIVNDRQFRLWRAWAARGWPTLALIDPRGYVVWQQAGEPRLAALTARVADLVATADAAGTLDRAPRPWQPHTTDAHTTDAHPADAPTASAARPVLHYPGGLALSRPDAQGVRRMAVTSNGHGGPGARVLLGRLTSDGRQLVVERVYDGGDDPFVRPQGLAFAPPAAGDPLDSAPTTLYVADTGTHRVRAIALATGAVRVVAGTGVRVRTAADRTAGAMASPWGLLAFEDGVLLVAMAGTHELWRVDPREAGGSARPVAGGRGEGLVDAPAGTPALDALLAQPVALASDGDRVWWIDAESSAVRESTRAALEGRALDGVRTLVGTGLFDFGDRDGVGEAVRLQHPQGLAWLPDTRQLLIADSYNDALKLLDPVTGRVETRGRGFAEPGALVADAGEAWVAEANGELRRADGTVVEISGTDAG